MNTNIITKQIIKTKRFVLAVFMLLTLSLNFSCIDNAEEFQVVTANPFGVGIIVFSSIPAQIFGNGIDQNTIKISTGLIPDGSSISARITGTNLESNVAGCVLSGSANVVDGMATFDFLNPIFIGNAGQIETVNLAVSIVIAGSPPPNDTPDTTVNDFVSLLINAVGIIPPDDTTVTPLPLSSPLIQFIDFEFATFGIPPTSSSGIEAECMVSNPDLGFIDNSTINGTTDTTPVLGSTETGRFIAKYFILNGTGGQNQVLTCMITLPNPADIDPGCENVPLNKRKITAEILIIHDPAPIPTPNDVTCAPNPITGGNDGLCTCNGINASGLEICISSPPGAVNIDACATADVNGTVVIPFNTDVVNEQVIESVSCTITEDSGFFAQTTVTVNPGIVNSLTCEPNPVESDEVAGGDENILVCTCDTNAPLTPICFEKISSPNDEIIFSSDPIPLCLSSDANGNAIIFPEVLGGITEEVDNILQCCIDSENDGDCDTNTTALETVTITPFVPPVTSISCTAQQTTLGPDGNTFLILILMDCHLDRKFAHR